MYYYYFIVISIYDHTVLSQILFCFLITITIFNRNNTIQIFLQIILSVSQADVYVNCDLQLYCTRLQLQYLPVSTVIHSYRQSNNDECTVHNLLCVCLCLCSSCIWSFMSIHIISQATDEVPMMQQQSVQQQNAAPGVGFQPWVQRHTSLSHPVTLRSLSAFALSSSFQPVTSLSSCLSLFLTSYLSFNGVSVQFLLIFDHSNIFCRKWLELLLITLYFLPLSLISFEHALVFSLMTETEENSTPECLD